MTYKDNTRAGKYNQPGAGRPPNHPAPPVENLLWVDGNFRVHDADDAETFELIGKLRAAAQPFGLVVQLAPMTDGTVEGVRRVWGNDRVSQADAEQWIREHPGTTFLRWTEEVFLGHDPMNPFTFAAAKAKARVALSRMWKAGRVRKGKNEYGQMTLVHVASKAPRADAVPVEVSVEVEKLVASTIRTAQIKRKVVSSAALAAAVMNVVWRKRLAYEAPKAGE